MFENKKVRTVVIIIGIIILIASAYSSWSLNKALDDENLSDDEKLVYQHDYLISKLAFLAGFLIALVPSVKGALYDIESMRVEAKAKSMEPKTQNETNKMK